MEAFEPGKKWPKIEKVRDKSTYACGERCRGALLNPKRVKLIKGLLKRNIVYKALKKPRWSMERIGKRFGVSRQAVGKIKNGESWKGVT